MFSAQTLSVLLVVAGTFQKVAGQERCQGAQCEKEKESCLQCPKGFVSRSSCVKDINRECGTCSEPNKFLIWSPDGPECASCKICRKESFLEEIQSCSLMTEAKCQCHPGYYCHTPLRNSCARCNPLTKCPPGRGVRPKGSSPPLKDTECEVCPSGTFSDVHSATEACKPHTDCDKSQRLTTRRGSAAADAECGGPKDPHLLPSENKTLRYTTYAASTKITTTTTTTTSPGTSTGTNKDGGGESGGWSAVIVAAAIVCVISLLVAFLLSWKQKICNLRLWKNFIQPELPGTTVTTNMEENREKLLPKGETTPETSQRSESAERDGTTEEKEEVQQRPEQMNNRIERIYIMNADTVLVGSVSEVSTRWRSGTTDCDGRESLSLVSRYPEQESSKLSASDLMISIEEEERESCAAKAMLGV